MENSRKIVETIKGKNIKPIPRGYFVAKGILAWLAFAVSVLIGAAAFSVILFSIQQTDFNLISHLQHSRFSFFLGVLPFFWITILIVFLIVGFFSVYHSKNGYKLRWSVPVASSVALSVLFGTLFFISGGAARLEKTFALRMSLYESIQEKKVKIWMMPEAGFLAGKIDTVSDSLFQMTDFSGKAWQVDFRNAFVAPVVLLENGETVKLVGKPTGTHQFRAEEVRPWGGPEHRKKSERK
ncbi:MAG: hypothetical protein R3D00_20755 [Bacteroidia bacterium]